MARKTLIILTVLLLGLLLTGPFPADAESVKDCVEKDADCPELDEDSGPMDEQSESTPPEEKETTGSVIWNLVQMAIALVFILALIYGLLYLLTKRNKMFSKVRTLENIGGISVGQNKSMQIVRIGKQFYVIGVGDNVQMLQEITDETVISELMNPEKETQQHPFAHMISGLKKQPSDETTQSFKSLYAKELDEMKKNRKLMMHKYKDERHE